jgi:hypothetical protein
VTFSWFYAAFTRSIVYHRTSSSCQIVPSPLVLLLSILLPTFFPRLTSYYVCIHLLSVPISIYLSSPSTATLPYDWIPHSARPTSLSGFPYRASVSPPPLDYNYPLLHPTTSYCLLIAVRTVMYRPGSISPWLALCDLYGLCLPLATPQLYSPHLSTPLVHSSCTSVQLLCPSFLLTNLSPHLLALHPFSNFPPDLGLSVLTLP